MRLPLPTDLKTRTGAPDKDARLKNCYVETRGDQGVVRKRPIAQGGIAVGTGTAQGGIGFSINGVPYVFGFWSDTLYPYVGVGTTWSNSVNYTSGDHVAIGFKDYWAINDNINSIPPNVNWSSNYYPHIKSYRWSAGTMTQNQMWYGLYTGSVFYAVTVTSSGPRYAASSSDGANWTPQTFDATADSVSNTLGLQYWTATTQYRAGERVLQGTYYYYAKIDNVGQQPVTGTSTTYWSVNFPLAGQHSYVWGSIAFNGNIYLKISSSDYNYPTAYPKAAISTDGVNWTINDIVSPSNSFYGKCIWTGTYFFTSVANTNRVAKSADGVNWTVTTANITSAWADYAWNGSVICALEGSSNKVYTSSDGITWATHTIQSANWFKISWNGTIFCATTHSGSNVAAISTDGITWTNVTMTTSQDWATLSNNGNIFVATSASSTSNVLIYS